MALVGSLDEGTSSARFSVFDVTGKTVATHQLPIESIYPHEGWVEQDPMHILNTVHECIKIAVEKLEAAGYARTDIKAIGITNQRETVVVWDRITGMPLHNAIVWLDTRTAVTVDRLVQQTPTKSKDYLKKQCGLPISTYFSAVKVRWLLDHVPSIREEADAGRCILGTIDSWLIWQLSGGINGGAHVTDVTNASRTMLMNIHSLNWDQDLCRFFQVPMTMLPDIRSSAENYGCIASGPLRGVCISGCLGDQQSALVGQMCLSRGDAKNTYGTGCFLLCNTGTKPVISSHGLLTTVAYRLGPQAQPHYALEGSIAIAGAAVQWLRDNLGIIKTSSEIETLASQVDTSHGVYFVPAFSGLLAPYWRHDARGVIVGLTQYSNKCHIARATLEAVCFQSREVLEAMVKDCKLTLNQVKVDGGMTCNNLLMQLQADLLGVKVVRPVDAETTSWGAAIAAAVAPGVNVWSMDELHACAKQTEFLPQNSADDRDSRYAQWRKAISRALDWEETADDLAHPNPPLPSVSGFAMPSRAGLASLIVLVTAVAAGIIALRNKQA